VSEFFRDATALTLVLFGAVLLSRGRILLTRGQLGIAHDESGDADRIGSAIASRRAAEGLDAPYASWLGLWALFLAGVTFGTRMTPVLSYALFGLGATTIATYAFARLRRIYPRGSAGLADRPSWYPRWVELGMFVAAALPLVYVTQPRYALAAIVATMSFEWLLVLASAVASLPLMLTGSDPALDASLDDRIRMVRVTSLIVLAAGLLLTFVALMPTQPASTYVGVCAVAFFAFFWTYSWHSTNRRSPLRPCSDAP